MPTLKRLGLFVWAGLAVVFSTGCGNDRLTYANYERIRDGMTAADVRAILGEPDKDKGGGISFGGIDASGRVMVWEEEEKFVQVTFVKGTFAGKIQRGLE